MNQFKSMSLVYKFINVALVFTAIISCKVDKSKDANEVENESKPESVKLLVGTYTNESSEGIYSLDFNPIDGSLENLTLVAKTESPSFLTTNKNKNYIFAVGENNSGQISAFKWNDNNTKLDLINLLPTEGKHPCYVELNNSENLVAAANYSSGNLAMYQVSPDGSILEPIQVRNHKGSSIVKPNQNKPHAHCSKFSKDDKFLYLADLGIDEMVGYTIDENNQLGKKFTALKMDAGDGPRHFTYHPTKNIVYIISEFSNTVTVATINEDTGVFDKIDKQSTLPKDFVGDSFCADIHISSNGKFLYASNRGHNSIAIFSVDKFGKIVLLGTESVRGDWPRNFTLSPDGEFLLVANQKSDNITVFKIGKGTGMLTFNGVDFKMSKPVCLKF